MGPKAKAKAKAGPKGTARLSAMKAGVKARAAPGRKRPAGTVGAPMKSPRTTGRGDIAEEAEKRWAAGYSVFLRHVDPREYEKAGGLVVLEGRYYHRSVTLAGQVVSVTMAGGAVHLKLSLTGTGDEELLKLHTGNPGWLMRGHICGQDCNQEEAAEDLVHLQVGRKMKGPGEDAPWVTNLEKPRDGGEDELALLRARAGADPPGREAGVEGGARPHQKTGEDGGAQKKKKKKRDKKSKKRRKRASEEEKDASSDEEIRLDGTRPRQANQKKARMLFAGTGLDPRDKVRNRVARRARKHMKKKAEKNSSSASGSETQSSSSVDGDEVEETLFDQGSKVRGLAEYHPGALASQALRVMRSSLLQERGTEDRPNTLPAVAVAYFRQHLNRKAQGPTARELMTLCHAVDQLLKARPASAMDCMIQRIKSIEQTMAGSHWSVSQRQEVLPADTVTLTTVPEATSAQKEVYQEAKARWFAAFPEGRVPKGGKGAGKAKSEGKDKSGGGADKERKGGKGGNKAEANKKKES